MSEEILDDVKRVFDLGANAGFNLLDPFAPSPALRIRHRTALAGTQSDMPRDRAAPVFFPLLDTLIARVTEGGNLVTVQKRMSLGDVADIGGRGDHRVGQSRFGIDPDVRLHAKVPLVAFLRLVHLGVALAVPVLRRAWRGDDRRIDYRAFLEQQALLCQVGVDRRKDSPGQAVRFE